MTKGRIFILFSAGIIAGGGVVALLMNQLYDSPKPAEKKQAKPTATEQETTEIKTRKIPLDSTGNYLDKKLPIAIKGDTNTDYYAHIDENSAVFDSLKSVENSAEISINRDQLIDSRKVKINSSWRNDLSKEDSTAMKIANIKSSWPTSIEVEFWQSPIHYKGYKLGKNKLVIFGIDAESEIVLFDLNDYVLLQSGSNYYRLDRTSEFRNLKKFTDQQVVSRLN